MSEVVKIEHQLQNAEEFITAASLLTDRHQLFTPGSVALHTGTELYLKAFLLNSNQSASSIHTHDLIRLYAMCVSIDPGLDAARPLVPLRWINQFGAFNGGVRYLKRSGNMYAVPVDIIHQVRPLFSYIRAHTDPEKEITNLL